MAPLNSHTLCLKKGFFNMPGKGFSLTSIFPYKDKIFDSVPIREIMGHCKTSTLAYLRCETSLLNPFRAYAPIYFKAFGYCGASTKEG